MASRFIVRYVAERNSGSYEQEFAYIAETANEARALFKSSFPGANYFVTNVEQDYNPVSPDEEKKYYDRKKREQEERIRREKAQEAEEQARSAAREARRIAHEALCKEAEQGDADAQFRLGLTYVYEQKSNTNKFVNSFEVVKANEWISKAAAQGHEQAKEYLAREEEKKAREAKEAAEKKAREAEEAAKRAKEAAEAAQKAAKERRKQLPRKIGRVVAAVLAATSVVMFFIGTLRYVWSSLLLEILSIIPFLIVYFCRGWVKKSIFFCGGIAWSVFLLQEVSDGRPPVFIAAIGFIVSYIIAMISPRK